MDKPTPNTVYLAQYLTQTLIELSLVYKSKRGGVQGSTLRVMDERDEIVQYIGYGGDFFYQYEELFDTAVEFHRGGNKDYKKLRRALRNRHEVIDEKFNLNNGRFSRKQGEYYVTQAFFEAFGVFPN